MATSGETARIIDAVEHREPDRVPVDFGGSMVTSIHEEGYDKLKDTLNILDRSTTTIARGRSLVAMVDPEVQDRLDVDARMLIVNGPDGWEAEAGQRFRRGRMGDPVGTARRASATTKSRNPHSGALSPWKTFAP